MPKAAKSTAHARTMLDEQFDRALEDYDEENIGALDDALIDGDDRSFDDAMADEAFDDDDDNDVDVDDDARSMRSARTSRTARSGMSYRSSASSVRPISKHEKAKIDSAMDEFLRDRSGVKKIVKFSDADFEYHKKKHTAASDPDAPPTHAADDDDDDDNDTGDGETKSSGSDGKQAPLDANTADADADADVDADKRATPTVALKSDKWAPATSVSDAHAVGSSMRRAYEHDEALDVDAVLESEPLDKQKVLAAADAAGEEDERQRDAAHGDVAAAVHRELAKAFPDRPADTELWDCESVMSTWTDTENHPRLVAEPNAKQIRLSRRTGLPIGVVVGNKAVDESGELKANVVDVDAAKRDDKDTVEDDDDGNDDDDDDDDDDDGEPANLGEARKRNETAEERRARKKAVKAERAARRNEKKKSKELYKAAALKAAARKPGPTVRPIA